MMLIPLVLSLSVHEFAHAWTRVAAWRRHAARQGRMTLNPHPHIVPIGTLLLPLARQSPSAGPSRSRSTSAELPARITMTDGHRITAAAGPISTWCSPSLDVVFALLIRFARERSALAGSVVQLLDDASS